MNGTPPYGQQNRDLKPSFSVGQDGFLLDGSPLIIRSATLHYFRIHPSAWEDRLLKLKAAGFNTVETYIPWSLSEKERGVFDFSGPNDVGSFLRLAERLGLYAIVRPGPYICAEWTGGGLPWWLLVDENGRMVPGKIRTSEEPYLSYALRYLKHLCAVLAPHQLSRGGNVLLFQIENEYGSYGNDKKYLSSLRDCLRENGIEMPLFTSDSPWYTSVSGGRLDGELVALNFGSAPEENFARCDAICSGPHFCAEFWDGWFDAWGREHVTRSPEDLMESFKPFLKNGDSFNVYVFCGGTNFGENAGANCERPAEGGFMPVTTSYDFDALLTEWGDYTPKFHAIRRALLSSDGRNPEKEPLPPRPVLQHVGRIPLTESCDPFAHPDLLGEKFSTSVPPTFEEMGLPGGLALYSAVISGPCEKNVLRFPDLRDFARVYLDGEMIGSVSRNEEVPSVQAHEIPASGARLKILVEAMGHVGYGEYCLDRKGLLGGVRYGGQRLLLWDTQTFRIENTLRLPFSPGLRKGQYGVTAFRGTFKAQAGPDAFLRIQGGVKGFAFVNGFNLGRYWAIGPQNDLYVPGALLKEENELIVLEIGGASEIEVSLGGERSGFSLLNP